MRLQLRIRVLPLSLLLCAAGAVAADDDPAPLFANRLDPVATEILKEATDYLKSAKTLAVKAAVDFEVFLKSGHKAQFEKQVDVLLKRPDKVHAYVQTDVANRRLYYDGNTVTIYNEDFNVYSTIDAAGTIDTMADAIYEQFDVALPLVDVLANDPYAAYETKVTSSRYLGLHQVSGELCHHLLLSNAEIDYQVWIADGDEPQLKKIVIDYVLEAGVPQYRVRFEEWARDTAAADTTFDFKPPEGSDKIDILPVIVADEGASE